MSDNVKVLIIGAGMMAKEYCKVLLAQNRLPIVIGRGEQSAEIFENETGISVLRGGIEKNLETMQTIPEYAIVAVSVDQLAHATEVLLNNAVKNILVEKPAGLNKNEIERLASLAETCRANVYVAYNRRFYASTDKALEIIENDGGVTSFNFEFTEWAHVIAATSHPKATKEAWFLANSTHVVDLAFFLGGFPREMSAYTYGELDWHSKASAYAGAGISQSNALFSYQANWAAPGRWGIEILTQKHRLYLRPMEQLMIQETGSVAINPVEIDDTLDKEYKPGLYRQTASFISGLDDGKKVTINEQLEHMEYYERMEQKI